MRIEASKEGSNAGRFAGGQDVENETRTSARTIGRAILSGTTLTSEGGIPVEVLFVKAFPTN
jgi:hypothetical protein